jgi:NADPH:quinone reductase-like Zn-dependent oxidoreductase
MERVVELHKSGAVRVPEVTVFPLAEARKALGVSEGRHFKGKLILEMR